MGMGIMSLLTNLPDRCTIRRRIRVSDSMGGSRTTFEVEQTNVPCWEQQASASEISLWQKRGISIQKKIYFTQDPQVTEQHEIVITHKMRKAVTDVPYDVV